MQAEIDNQAWNWIQRQSSYEDVWVVVIVCIAVASYRWRSALVNSVDIPDAFWYRIPQSSDNQVEERQKKAQARNVTATFKESNLDAIIFWGSQSGRAEVLARALVKYLQDRFALNAIAADLFDYDHEHLSETKFQLCGFILSTYGDGDPPDNTNGFWNAVQSFRERKVGLHNLHYVLFGLGNSQYRQFNRVANTVDSIFRGLGAVRYGEMGEGDDATSGTEDAFLAWKHHIGDHLQTTLQLTEQTRAYQPVFEVRADVEEISDGTFLGEPHASLLPQASSSRLVADPEVPQIMSASRARKLWQTPDRLCIHMELELSANRLVKYKTGDHLAIWPCNPDHEVERLLSALGLTERRSQHILIRPINSKSGSAATVPNPTTFEALFRHYLELCSPLSRDTISSLVQFAPSERARAELRRISGDATSFRDKVSNRHLTLSSLLTTIGDEAVWDVPMSFLLETMKRMQPRYYSISSSAAIEPRTISITVVLDNPPEVAGVDKLKPWGCYGLATHYLDSLEKSLNTSCASASAPVYDLNGPRGVLGGGKVFGRVRQSAFKLPFKASTAIIMVGCGTGVAPFRAFVQERARRKQIGQEVGKTILLMGFRKASEDFIYEDEWRHNQQVLGDDVLKIWTAFSREDPLKKVYVQDRLTEHAEEILAMLEEDVVSRMFICGSASMARDVAATLAEMRQAKTGAGAIEANEWVKKLRQSKQLLEDVWG